jgi:hypothetical protein
MSTLLSPEVIQHINAEFARMSRDVLMAVSNAMSRSVSYESFVKQFKRELEHRGTIKC